MSAMAFLLFAATAQAAPSPPVEKPITVLGETHKKICHTETPTGSAIPRRICLTEEQSDAQAAYSVLAKQNAADDQDSRENILRQK